VTPRPRVIVLCLLLAAGAAGCGQQGPLALPDGAGPVERIDPPANEQEADDAERDER
jgi:predicted small lipoprotein YifL